MLQKDRHSRNQFERSTQLFYDDPRKLFLNLYLLELSF